MSYRPRVLISAATLIVTLIVLSANPVQSQKAQETKQETKGGIAPRIYYQPCFPAEVSAITGGAREPGAIISELTVKTHSTKPITAVRLGWYVFDDKTTGKTWKAACGDEPMTEKPILSGKTQLIELGRIYQNTTINIGTAPRQILWPADITLFIKSPLITMSDLQSLSTDGTRKGIKEVYGMFVAVCEVYFDDRTKWEAEQEPPFLKQTK